MTIKRGLLLLVLLFVVGISVYATADVKEISKNTKGIIKVTDTREDVCADLPKPVISYIESESVTDTNGKKVTRHYFSIDNWEDYSTSLFTSAPDLPACGENTNATRTWVSIYDQNGTYIYNYCVLGKPEYLSRLWFPVVEGEPVPDSFSVVIEDRRCKKTSRSDNQELLAGSANKNTKKDPDDDTLFIDPNLSARESGGDKQEKASDQRDGESVTIQDIHVVSPPEPPECDLPAPVQISPEEDEVIDNIQRKLVCTWEPVEGAASYTLQVDCYHCCESYTWCTEIGEEYRLIEKLKETTSWIYLGGMNEYKWRVWAVDSDGKKGAKSPWRKFTTAS